MAAGLSARDRLPICVVGSRGWCDWAFVETRRIRENKRTNGHSNDGWLVLSQHAQPNVHDKRLQIR